MKAVIYARYSSDNQREESIEGQLRECNEYAEKNGITILNSYIDRAFSAKTDNRPEFQRMVKDSAKGLFDVVIVWKLDRFARNRYDSAHYKSILRKNGVKVVSAKETIAEDSTGILLESLLEGYAEFYSAELSEKVIRGMTENALKCKWNGGIVPLGYKIDKDKNYQIDNLTAHFVIEAFKSYAENFTIKQVVDLLNEKGVHNNHGGKISINNVNYMLKNRVYIGEYSYREMVKENGVPPIISKEIFEAVQKKIQKNKKAPARNKAEDKYLLTTKLFCGKCGVFMVGESGTSRTKLVHRYYKCVNTKKKKLCDKKAVKKDWIEDIVIEQTMQMLFDDNLISYIADILIDMQGRENTDLPFYKNKLTETEKAIDNMLNAIQQGVLTSSTKKRLDELEQTKSELEISIINEEMHKPIVTKEQIVFWLHKFRKIDVTDQTERQRLVDIFINSIYLYDDKLVLTFNYKDGTKTITFDEIKSSDLNLLGEPNKKTSPFGLVFLFCFSIWIYTISRG